jgi:hypothetical protein
MNMNVSNVSNFRNVHGVHPGGSGGRCAAEDAPGDADASASDPAVCSDGRAVDAPVLFRKEAPDVAEVDSGDITQGHLPDCFFLAPLAAMARTEQGRALIRNSIAENRGPDGSVASYTVTLHRPIAGMAWRSHEMKVVVSASEFGCNHALARRDGATGQREIWPLVYESAYLQSVGGAATVERNGGGGVSGAMETLTGRPATTASPSAAEGSIEGALQRHGLVVVATVTANASPLRDFHAYVVTRAERSSGELVVHLHNPYNDEPDLAMTYRQLTRLANSVTIGSLP